MKAFLSVFLVLMLHLNVRAEVLFVGVIRTAAQTSVALEDSDTRAFAWVEVGGRFQSYRVVEITAPFDFVTLERNGVILRVRLQDSKIENPDQGDPSTREARFHSALLELDLSAMKNKRSPSIDELIAVALRFGRVVLRREVTEAQDVILVGLPGSKADFEGKDVYMTTNPNRAEVRAVTLMIR